MREFDSAAWSQYGCHQLTGAEVTVEVADRKKRHRPAGPGCCAADVREQNHVVQGEQLGRHIRFIDEDV